MSFAFLVICFGFGSYTLNMGFLSAENYLHVREAIRDIV